MSKQPLSRQLDTPAQPCSLHKAGGTALDRSAPASVPLPRCCARPPAEFSPSLPSLPSSRQQPPRRSSQALRQPVSTCLRLSLSSITSPSRAGERFGIPRFADLWISGLALGLFSALRLLCWGRVCESRAGGKPVGV